MFATLGSVRATESLHFSDSRFFAKFILKRNRRAQNDNQRANHIGEVLGTSQEHGRPSPDGAEPEAAIRARLEVLRHSGRITAVETSDKNVVKIDTSYLVAELRNDPPDLERLAKPRVLLNAHGISAKVFTLQDVQLQGDPGTPGIPMAGGRVSKCRTGCELLQRFFDLIDRIGYGVRNVFYYGRVPLIVAAALLFLLSLFYISRSLSRSLVREARSAPRAAMATRRLHRNGR
jgi:hypothetical protein